MDKNIVNYYYDTTDNGVVDVVKARKLTLHQDYYRHRAKVILELLRGEEIYEFSEAIDKLYYAERIAAVKYCNDIKWSFWRQMYWIIKLLITRG